MNCHWLAPLLLQLKQHGGLRGQYRNIPCVLVEARTLSDRSVTKLLAAFLRRRLTDKVEIM